MLRVSVVRAGCRLRELTLLSYRSRYEARGRSGSTPCASRVAARMATEPLHQPLELRTGDWLFGLVVLTAGVLLPLLFAWKKLFGTPSSGGKRSQ